MRHRVINEFLDLLRQRAEENFKGKLHQAFLAWYVEAEFGQAQWKFTDDNRDGGIDAVVWRPRERPPLVIIQSKFAQDILGRTLDRGAYEAFKQLVIAFRDKGYAFNQLLESVRDDLRPTYRKALDELASVKHWAAEKRAFRIITTCRARPKAEFDLIPRDGFVYGNALLRLYEQYRTGYTPRAKPLELRIDDKLTYQDQQRDTRSYLFNARLSDIRDYLETTDPARLVARNVRYNLGGRIAREIRKTYEQQPDDFWYFHNGLTIVCDEMPEVGGHARLINPSVINGAQTLYAINASRKRRSSALISVRVIIRDPERGPHEDDRWLQKVIRNVNTQNRVHRYDLRSNDPEQIELQRQFREVKVFYERKRGEWKEFRNEPRFKGFDRIPLPKLGNILTATGSTDCQGVLLVKKGLDQVFDDKNYHKRFPSRSVVVRRFKRIYFAYRLHRLLGKLGYADTNHAKRQKHAFWSTLWLLHRAVLRPSSLPSSLTVTALKHGFDDLEGDGQRARRVLCKLTKFVWAVWREANKQDPERSTPNNFFKSKHGNDSLPKKVYPRITTDLRTFARYIWRVASV